MPSSPLVRMVDAPYTGVDVQVEVVHSPANPWLSSRIVEQGTSDVDDLRGELWRRRGQAWIKAVVGRPADGVAPLLHASGWPGRLEGTNLDLRRVLLHFHRSVYRHAGAGPLILNRTKGSGWDQSESVSN